MAALSGEIQRATTNNDLTALVRHLGGQAVTVEEPASAMLHRRPATAFRLNPPMTGKAQLWSNKHLAIVRGVGYPKPDHHSHFRSMDIWQTASPTAPINTGWIGRWLDTTGNDPTRAVNIGSVLPPLAVGARGAAAALPLGKSTTLPADLGAALAGLGKPDASDTPFRALVAQSYCSERKVDATFSSIIHAAADDDDDSSAAGSAGGQSGLAAQFDKVARCIKANVPTTVYTVSLGGFDTHANEKGTQQTQLATMDAALSTFLKTVSALPRGKDVVVLAYSEFGRRVGANAFSGTDHGTAAPAFIAELGVRGEYWGDGAADDGHRHRRRSVRVEVAVWHPQQRRHGRRDKLVVHAGPTASGSATAEELTISQALPRGWHWAAR